jgi:16S rRNA G966 N2-methylase RsmD
MTYSNKGDIVMDFSMGSGSCGVSAKMTGRNFIGVEKEEEYFKIAESRINSAKEDCVNENDSQLTTQISKDMKTTPDAIYEKGKLENIRNGEFDDPPESESFSRLFEIS